MHYNISKLLLCFLFGMTSSEYYASSASASAARQMYRDRIHNDGIGDISGNSSGKTRKSLKRSKPSANSNNSDSSDSGTSTQDISRLSTGAGIVGLKNEQNEFSPKKIATGVASQHVANAHVTNEVKNHLLSVYSDAVVKLITGTKEGYMFEHMSLLSNFESSSNFTELASVSDHPTGGPLETGGLLGSTKNTNDAVRNAYAELVNQVTASKTSKDFEMLLASTGGTIDGKALESDKSNSHQQLLTGELNKVSVTINGITYSGVNGLKKIEELLQNPNLSVKDKTKYAALEDQLSQKLADAVNTYHDNHKQGMGTATNDIYFNKSAYEEYTTNLKEDSLYKSVLKMASENFEELNRIGSMNAAELKKELLDLAGSNTFEKHHLGNTLGLIDATSAAYTHLKNVDLDEFNQSHPSVSSEYNPNAIKDGDAHAALKAFYNSIPLSYDGIMAAISVTGGSKDGKSHQDLIKTNYAVELAALKQLHKEFSENPTTANQDKITAAAKDLKEKLIDHVTETIDLNKKDNAYLYYGELMVLNENREETYKEHYEQVSSIYHLHETMTAAHTAAVNNAKKTSTSD